MTKAFLPLCAMLLPIGLAVQSPGSHHAGVDARGDAVMGFSHETTTHRFTLLADGGTIAATARDGADRASISQIRSHLTHIASMFADGNFQAPMLIHAKTPPGVAVMRERKSAITYTYEETATGGWSGAPAHRCRGRLLSARPAGGEGRSAGRVEIRVSLPMRPLFLTGFIRAAW